MAVVELRYHELPPDAFRSGVVAVGNFDGVHRGHAALIETAKAAAARLGGPTIPITFDPHPVALLHPDRFEPQLTTIGERARLLHQIGADHVVVLRTTPELLALSPEYFFETILGQAMRARGVVEGFNFQFGHRRAGTNASLRKMCEASGMEFQEVHAFELGGSPVSSSRIRSALKAGEVAVAAELLGRPFRISGNVGTGARRGRTIGFPTANLHDVATLLPGDGVYAVRATTAAGVFAGAANVGANPTFGEHQRKIEVHLIDFTGDLYGQTIHLDFIAKIRDTCRFDGVEALKRRLLLDVASAQELVRETV